MQLYAYYQVTTFMFRKLLRKQAVGPSLVQQGQRGRFQRQIAVNGPPTKAHLTFL
jgi:hypothetical protein